MVAELIVVCSTVLLFRLLDHCVRALERRHAERMNQGGPWPDVEAQVQRLEVMERESVVRIGSVLERLEAAERKIEQNGTQLGLMSLSKRPEGGR